MGNVFENYKSNMRIKILSYFIVWDFQETICLSDEPIPLEH